MGKGVRKTFVEEYILEQRDEHKAEEKKIEFDETSMKFCDGTIVKKRDRNRQRELVEENEYEYSETIEK